jgi:hypothetical protein
MSDEFVDKAKEVVTHIIEDMAHRLEEERKNAEENPGDINSAMPDYFKEMTGQLDTLGEVVKSTLETMVDNAKKS